MAAQLAAVCRSLHLLRPASSLITRPNSVVERYRRFSSYQLDLRRSKSYKKNGATPWKLAPIMAYSMLASVTSIFKNKGKVVVICLWLIILKALLHASVQVHGIIILWYVR